MRIRLLGLGGLVLSLGLGLSACSSDDTSSGTDNAGGSSSSTAGSSGSGGSQGTSGTQGTGGQGTGGSSNGGSAGSSGASSGSGGSSVTDAGKGADALAAPDATGSVDAGPFALTSSAYTEGMTIPAVDTCAGANTSPPLAWTPGPAGTKSYTLTLTDKSNMLVHWTLWDIPASTMSLPAALPSGSPVTTLAPAQQVSFQGKGYAGPCPGADVHTYQFDLYAVDVANLPGLNGTSAPPAVVTAVMAHKLKVTSLSGMAKTK